MVARHKIGWETSLPDYRRKILMSCLNIIHFDVLLGRDNVYCGILVTKPWNMIVSIFPAAHTVFSVRVER